MKRLVNHKINELNNRISILYDDPDESGASHIYNINVFTNNDALIKLQECMMWLERRTRDRINRGVEGTNQL